MNQIPAGSIVVAVDDSSDSDRAVYWAAEQAFAERRCVEVLHVVADVGGERQRLATAVLDRALALARRHRPGLGADGHLVIGDPRRALVELTVGAHLLVLGSRGRGVLGSKLLGSVSETVSRHASCPVVVCRPGTELKVKRGVLVGVDATPESLVVIDFAFRQASLRSQPLTIVHCVWDPVATMDSPHVMTAVTDPHLEEARLLLAESIAGFRERFPEVFLDLKIARGLPAACLAAASDHHDLVVVGRHPRASLGRRLAGTVSTAVIEHSRTNIAVVPESAAA